MPAPSAIVIGSGVAGLATAIRLQVQGFAVTVYEKNAYPGGKLSYFEQDGYCFDAGPSLFTQPENLAELFELAGESIEDYFRYEAVPIACRYFFENGKRINAYTNVNAYAQELHTQCGESPESLQQYLNDAGKLYEDVGKIFLHHSLHKRSTWLHRRIFQALRTVKSGHLFQSLNQFNEARFRTPEVRQLFNRYATYNGSNPYQAPGMLSVIPHLEQNGGTYYPKGGMISITNALYQLALKKGVQFQFNQPVERIIQHERKVRGVVVNGQNISCDVVVSNGDVYFTYKHLLRNEGKARGILKNERSSSALIFYWGIRQAFPELQLHNILFSNHYPEEFKHIFKIKTLYSDPTVYINITSKLEAGMAPAGGENWFVMINAPAVTGSEWEAWKTQARRNIIEKINRVLVTDIEPLIATEAILDPVTIETKTGSYLGSLYGTSSNSRMAAFARHPNFSASIKGLYFVGGSVHPGGGIPLCFKSARITSELIASSNIKPHA